MSLEIRPALDLQAARVLAAATAATAYWEGFISCLCLRDVQDCRASSSTVSIKSRVTVVVGVGVVGVCDDVVTSRLLECIDRNENIWSVHRIR
jgi:hypothetical protein